MQEICIMQSFKPLTLVDITFAVLLDRNIANNVVYITIAKSMYS